MYGSVAGVHVLKTDLKISAETVVVRVDPTSVTLISRPDTPRRLRSSRASDPTFVRGSRVNTAESSASVYDAVFQVACGDAWS